MIDDTSIEDAGYTQERVDELTQDAYNDGYQSGQIAIQQMQDDLCEARKEITRLQQQVKERGQIGLYEKIVNRIIERYKMYPVQVANACDEEIDTSGNLLGWIREAAMNEDRTAK